MVYSYLVFRNVSLPLEEMVDAAARTHLSSETHSEHATPGENKETFALDNPDVGYCGIIKHRIPTQSAPPVYRRAYQIPDTKRDEMQQRLDELLDKGIIKHSKSPWGAPALLVEKPDGSFRRVADSPGTEILAKILPPS